METWKGNLLKRSCELEGGGGRANVADVYLRRQGDGDYGMYVCGPNTDKKLEAMGIKVRHV